MRSKTLAIVTVGSLLLGLAVVAPQTAQGRQVPPASMNLASNPLTQKAASSITTSKLAKRKQTKRKKARAGVPRPVMSAKVTPLTATKAKIKWTSSRFSKSYVIRIARDSNLKIGARVFKSKKRTRVISMPSSTPGITYWYRIYGQRGKVRSPKSVMRRLDLRATTPTNLRVSSSKQAGLALLWASGSNAQHYQIQVSTDLRFASGSTRTYTSKSQTGAFAPPNLDSGRQYSFRVRAINPSSTSAWVTTSGTALSNHTPLTVGSFNIHRDFPRLPLTNARIGLVADEIRRGEFQVVGLQETNIVAREAILERIGEYSASQADMLIDGRRRNPAGDQILYRGTYVTPTGASGVVRLPSPADSQRHATYQEFRHNQSNARFLFVATHLTVGKTAATINWREKQLAYLMTNVVHKYGSGIPVVVVGDMNSYFHHSITKDAPARSFASQLMPDALLAAQTRLNLHYNSVNQLRVQPVTSGHHSDYIYTSPGVVASRGEIMPRLSGLLNRTPFASDHNAIRAELEIPY